MNCPIHGTHCTSDGLCDLQIPPPGTPCPMIGTKLERALQLEADAAEVEAEYGKLRAWTPDEVSEVIVLRAVGLSWGQIAQRLGKTKSQVQRLHVRHTERLAR